MNPLRAARDLEKLRKYRVRGERDRHIGDEVVRQRTELEKVRKSLKGAGEAWGKVIPEAIAKRCRLVSLARGVLSVRTEDSATGYELDRFLRGGGLREVQRACTVTVSRIKIINS